MCLQSKDQKTRDHNCTLGNLLTLCLFYEEFDPVLGAAQSQLWCMMTWSAGLVPCWSRIHPGD